MSPEAMQYHGFVCEACEREFVEFANFRGHAGPDGRPCPGGRPA